VSRSPAVLGPPVQVAYAVEHLATAVDQWVEHRGAGPFYVLEHIPLSDVRVFGQPGAFDHSSAYGQWGSVMVELVQDHTAGPSPVAGSGLHHVAHFVDDIAATSLDLVANGWPEALWATTSGGNAFAFHDARRELGHMVEIYEGSQRLRQFYARVAAAADDWDGHDRWRAL
jgi:hypothetical protein